MGRTFHVRHLGGLSVSSFVTVALLLAVGSAAWAAPTGQVTFATSWATFNCKGGDPATQTGAPSYVSQTCFDSLV